MNQNHHLHNQSNSNHSPAQVQPGADDKQIRNLLKCSLCLSYLYEPVTLQCCGNTFCKDCLLRLYDSASTKNCRASCALCREVLSFQRELTVNKTLWQLVQQLVPQEKLLKRRQADCIEIPEVQLSGGLSTFQQSATIPLFVLNCTLYPGAPLPLHVFEPRYRLMIRRCIRGSRRFGLICMETNSLRRGVRRIGTLCQIEHVHVFDDGRMFIMTRAERRFAIEPREGEQHDNRPHIFTHDGYPCANVTWIHEEPTQSVQEDTECASMCKHLHSAITQFLKSMSPSHSKILSLVQQKIGTMPPRNHMEAFSFWSASFLSGLMDQEYAHKILECRTTRERLSALIALASRTFESGDTKQSLFLRKQLIPHSPREGEEAA
mmetsp:Transcript_5238/g.19606  ORF Transcript_5238/g.19606 Transcript_5238/m.19606 type:complete len:377 (+) Transcript_5238:438-1568(+)